MKSGRRGFWYYALVAYCFLQIVTPLRTGDHIWLVAQIGITFSLIVGMILEIQWPESATRPKAAKVAWWTLIVILIVSGPVAIWRDLNHRAAAQTVVEPVVSTVLQITPAQAAQGKTLEVAITTTSYRFTDRSVPHFGSGITVLDSHNTSETALAARIEIVAGAATGFRRIWVTTPGAPIAMDDSPRGAFAVLEGIPADK